MGTLVLSGVVSSVAVAFDPEAEFAKGTTIVGVQIGVVVALALPEHALRRLFGILLLATAAQIAWRTSRRSSTLP